MLTNLEHKILFSLQFEIQHGLFDEILEVHVSLARDVQCGEKISDEAHEDWHVVGDDLGHVEVSQRPH